MDRSDDIASLPMPPSGRASLRLGNKRAFRGFQAEAVGNFLAFQPRVTIHLELGDDTVTVSDGMAIPTEPPDGEKMAVFEDRVSCQCSTRTSFVDRRIDLNEIVIRAIFSDHVRTAIPAVAVAAQAE